MTRRTKNRDGPTRLADEPEDDGFEEEFDPVTGLRKPSPQQVDDQNNTGSLGDPVGVDF